MDHGLDTAGEGGSGKLAELSAAYPASELWWPREAPTPVCDTHRVSVLLNSKCLGPHGSNVGHFKKLMENGIKA